MSKNKLYSNPQCKLYRPCSLSIEQDNQNKNKRYKLSINNSDECFFKYKATCACNHLSCNQFCLNIILKFNKRFERKGKTKIRIRIRIIGMERQSWQFDG